MARPQKPNAAFVTNGWYFELPGLVSPHFEQISGISKKTGNVQIVDAGSNIKYNFSSQILDFGQISLSRTRDGSSDDRVMAGLVEASIATGAKFAGVMVKLHFGKEVYRIAFTGLKFMEENRPEYNTSSEEKELVQYTATVDTWIEF